MSIVFTSIKHPKLPISIQILVTANCLYLHDSYIFKFEFMNYLDLKSEVYIVNKMHVHICKSYLDQLINSKIK